MNAIVMTDRSGTRKYLSALQFFCYGEKVIARYEDHPSLAFPLDVLQCEKLIPMLRCEFPSFGAANLEKGIPGIKFSIVDFPLLDPEVADDV